MRKIFTAFVALLLSVSLIVCSNMYKKDDGMLTRCVAGGLIGSTVGQGSGQVLAIAAGTLAGAFISNAVGKSMDETDQLKMQQALNNNAVGEPAYWRNSKNNA